MTLARACAPLVLICAAIAAPALAQPVPAKAVRLIVPFAVGGRSDVIARTVGQKLAERWGQPVVIENKPGTATPADEFGRFLASEHVRWSAAVKAANVTVQ